LSGHRTLREQSLPPPPAREKGDLAVLPYAMASSAINDMTRGGSIDARAISRELDLGKLVLLRHDPKSTAAAQLDASGMPVGGEQRLLYMVLDPAEVYVAH
jgi:hypothetical protein